MPKISQPNRSPNHLLTILVEDYFHVDAFEELIRHQTWENFEARFEQSTIKTLDLLDESNTKGTFFILGWIAEQNPGLVREIVARGHEVASRGFYHRPIDKLTEEEFRNDIRRAREAIEKVTGQKVLGYRSPNKLSFGKHQHILDTLVDEGFAYDASFLPSNRTPRKERFAHQYHSNGKVIWEFPYSTRNLGLGLLPISGGNYLRQIPFTLLRHAIRDWTKRYESPFMLYFHVWELDPQQPRISAATHLNRIRHYRKLDKMEWVVKEILSNYNFSSVAQYLNLDIQTVKNEDQITTSTTILSKEGANQEYQTISVVIPCFNEAESLSYLSNSLTILAGKMTQAGYNVNFLFVDDCSTDKTLELLKTTFGDWKNVKILRHRENQGVAASIKTGIDASTTEIVCSMDCDCSYDPNELVNMIPLLTEDVDMVTASPYHRDGKVRNVPEWRLFLSKGASWLYRQTLNADLSTFTSCFRVYRRSSVVQIETTERGFLGVAELLGRLDLAGGKIVEHPAVLQVRLFGFSKMKTMRTVVGHLILLKTLKNIKRSRNNVPIKTTLNKNKKIGNKQTVED